MDAQRHFTCTVGSIMGERDYIIITQIRSPPFDLLDHDEDDVLCNPITPAELGGAQGDSTLATQTLHGLMQE